jgi:hypothetical protein
MDPMDDDRSEPGSLATMASEVASQLSTHRDVDAILLYGSVARGDADSYSDIDLLIVGRDEGQTVAGLRHWIGSVDPDNRASYVFHTRESFDELIEEGSTFLAHLKTEGQVLLDRTGQLTAFLSRPWQPESVEAEIALALERLQNYERPEIFGGRFLFALAHVFTIGKAIVMARLAAEGHLEIKLRTCISSLAWSRSGRGRAGEVPCYRSRPPAPSLRTSYKRVSPRPGVWRNCAEDPLAASRAPFVCSTNTSPEPRS